MALQVVNENIAIHSMITQYDTLVIWKMSSRIATLLCSFVLLAMRCHVDGKIK